MLFALFQCSMPANTGMIFNALMEIAAFDAIPTEQIYDELVGVDFGEAITANFETVGLESSYIINNLGSLGLVIMLYPLLYLLYYVSAYCRCCKFVRKRRKSLHRNLFWGALFRLVIESYLIGLLCCAINYRLVGYSVDSPWDQANAAFCTLLAVVYLSFPLYVMCFLSKNWNQLQTKSSIQVSHGELIQNLNLKTTKHVIWHVRMDYLRKIALT